jgi:lambda family phage tail tape measure protein
MAGKKAQLEFTADASGVEAGVAKAKRSLADLGATAASEGKKASDSLSKMGDGSEKAAAKIDAATKNSKAAFERYIATLETGKKTGVDFLESLSRKRGADLNALQPLIDQARAFEAQIKKTTAATVDFSKVTTSLGAKSTLAGATTSLGATDFQKPFANSPAIVPATVIPPAAAAGVDAYTKSVKQLAMQHQIAAVQVKDFIEQVLAGGSPLRAFAMQGAAVVSNYGGFGNTLRALGGLLTPLNVSLGVAAVAVTSLAVAMYQGAQESTAYAKALLLTGNSIGKTTDQLREMAGNIAATTGTQGDAAEALAALAQSGKIASSSLTDVGAAVVSMNRVLGTSVDEAVAVFTKLADEPTKASAKLNEQMHYLNLTTYERIRALEDQGQKEEAAALAQTTYANATTTRLGQVEQQAGVLARAWRALAHDAKEAWDLMQGVGRPKTTGEMLSAAQQNLADLKARGPIGGPVTGQSDFNAQLRNAQSAVSDLTRKGFREQEAADAEGQRARDQAAKISASDRIKTLSDEVRTNADKRKKALADLDRDFKTLGKSTSGGEYDKLVANINEKFKDPAEKKGPAEKAYQDDAATKMLENLRQQEAALKEQLTTDEKLTSSEKDRAKFVQLVTDLKGKGTLTVEQKSLLLAQDSIKAQLDKNVALEAEVKAREDARKEAERLDQLDKQFAERSRQRTEAINSSIDSQQDQSDRIRATFGLGDRARQEVEAQRSIFREYNKMQLDLVKNTPEHLLGSDKFQEEVAKIAEARETALGIQKKLFADEKTAREDWIMGAKSALANYIDYVDNAAQRANALITNSLSGLSDSITEAIFGDKGDSFKKLGENISKQIVHGIVEQQITKPVAEWLQGSLSDPDSMIGKLLGGLTSNKGTGENWLGFLGLGGGGKGGSAATRGSSLSNPLFVKSVDAVGGAANDSSSGGLFGTIGKLFGGLGGMSNSAATTAANAMPGDALDNLINLQGGWGTMLGFANGGDPPMGRASIVGERGPELFIPKQPGTVVPAEVLQNMRASRGAPVVNIAVEGQVDRRTRTQIANDTSLALRRGGRMA